MERFPEGREGRCGAVVANGLVYAVATDPVCADGIVQQTLNTLNDIERMLLKVGSGKDKLIQSTVYLSDMRTKAEMDSVWGQWVGEEKNWPQRACVGVELEPGYLIEVVVTAAVEK